MLGCTLALERGLACSTGGGTHHAFPDHGSGFCLINDMAVAARYVIKKRLAERVLIVDLDVHQVSYTTYYFFPENLITAHQNFGNVMLSVVSVHRHDM